MRMESLWVVLRVAALSYAGLVLLLYLTQGRMLYYPELPSREVRTDPSAIGLTYEAVALTTSDNVKLDGWFVPAAPGSDVVLFLHGNAGNIGHRLDSLRIFHDLNLAVLIFDYRGYGRSTGKPSEAGTYEDAATAWRHLTQERGYKAEQIVLFGRSLGAAVAAQLATQQTPRALIVESAFTSVPDMAADLYPFLPARLLARYDYATARYLHEVRCPLLVVHSRDDEIIPFHHGERIYSAANEPKRFLEIRGGHNEGFLLSETAYRQGLADFLNTLAGT